MIAKPSRSLIEVVLGRLGEGCQGRYRAVEDFMGFS